MANLAMMSGAGVRRWTPPASPARSSRVLVHLSIPRGRNPTIRRVSSGIVAEAAASGTAVLGSAEGGIGRQIQAHGLGQTIRSRDDRALAEALARAAIDDPEVDETRRTAFAREGRDPAFGQAWLRLLDLARRDR